MDDTRITAARDTGLARWIEAPSPLERRRFAWLETVAGVVVVGAPAVALAAAQEPPTREWLAVAAAAVVAALLPSIRALSVRVAGVVVLSTLVAAFVGRPIGLSLLLGWLLFVAAGRHAADVDALPSEVAGPLVGAAVLAAALVPAPGNGASALLIQAVGLVAVTNLPAAPGVLQRVSAGLVAAVLAATRVVNAVLFGVLGVVTIAVPWVVQRLFAVDPLRRVRRPSRWVALQRAEPRPRRAWALDPALRRADRFHTLRRALASVALTALVVVAGLYAARWVIVEDPAVVAAEYWPDAVRDDAWWPEYLAAIRWLNTPGKDHAYLPFPPIRLRDFTSPYVNVEGGVRASWVPPACGDCTRLSVWMYGGSTTFGIGQRDGHTIASELARLAWEEDGIALDVANRGMPTELHWEEAQRFAWDVASDPKPDAVVFFDGINEMWASSTLNARGQGDDESRTNPETQNAKSQYESLIPTADGFFDPPKPDDLEVADDRPDSPDRLPADRLADHVIARYEKSIDMSRGTAAAHDIATTWFWQPCPLSGAVVPDEPKIAESDRTFAGDLCHDAAAMLPDDVVDLSRGYDGRTEGIYLDSFHTNEDGARMAAKLIYAEIGPRLRVLAAGAGS